MAKLTKVLSSVTSFLVITTLLTIHNLINYSAIAQEVTKKSENELASEILKHTNEVKQLEKSCTNKDMLNTLQNFRDFQIRLDTGINNSQFLNYLADLKIASNHLKNIDNLSNDCSLLNSEFDKVILNYDRLAIFWRLEIEENLGFAKTDSMYGIAMLKLFPEIPITDISGENYVYVKHLINYLIMVSKL